MPAPFGESQVTGSLEVARMVAALALSLGLHAGVAAFLDLPGDPSSAAVANTVNVRLVSASSRAVLTPDAPSPGLRPDSPAVPRPLVSKAPQPDPIPPLQPAPAIAATPLASPAPVPPDRVAAVPRHETATAVPRHETAPAVPRHEISPAVPADDITPVVAREEVTRAVPIGERAPERSRAAVAAATPRARVAPAPSRAPVAVPPSRAKSTPARAPARVAAAPVRQAQPEVETAAQGQARPAPRPAHEPAPLTVAAATPLASATRPPEPPRPLAGNPRPGYPLLARRRGQQGAVLVRLDVAVDGTPSAVRVVSSSGVASLDEAAREAVSRWRFAPARRDGRAEAATVDVPVEFRLDGSG